VTGSGAKAVGNKQGVGEPTDSEQGQASTDLPAEVYAPSRPGGDGDLVRVKGQRTYGGTKQNSGPTGAGDPTGASRPYNDAYNDYSGAATSYLDDHYIPIALKDYVRDYFVGIAPEGK